MTEGFSQCRLLFESRHRRERTVEELGQDLLRMVVETACGKQTKAESLGFTETAIARLCNYV